MPFLFYGALCYELHMFKDTLQFRKDSTIDFTPFSSWLRQQRHGFKGSQIQKEKKYGENNKQCPSKTICISRLMDTSGSY